MVEITKTKKTSYVARSIFDSAETKSLLLVDAFRKGLLELLAVKDNLSIGGADNRQIRSIVHHLWTALAGALKDFML